MKSIIKIILAGSLLLSLGSCSVSGPLFITDNPGGKSNKTGEASYKVTLGFMPFNADASIETAAKNGNITKVATVDTKITGGLFSTTYTTVVTGE
jgi:predicted small lipoprotein YifL